MRRKNVITNCFAWQLIKASKSFLTSIFHVVINGQSTCVHLHLYHLRAADCILSTSASADGNDFLLFFVKAKTFVLEKYLIHSTEHVNQYKTNYREYKARQKLDDDWMDPEIDSGKRVALINVDEKRVKREETEMEIIHN